ncbi:TPA: SMC family ATPase [Enterococcus faecium]|nr:SMC family ATPase [Enterococcus faecium]HAQ4672105.1 SMC family ATPase [Enterococcus faecium]HAQ4706160.1 SMC family ATPase [Enterococcus faecium]HAQ5979473.1 SMC family ATPase [Enterococcus faecium]HAR1637936.1 SMC family ATPase [Enterococcus faecium]
MKPKKLKLKNFGPFINETVDFSRLTEAPLFLISGKTGAGKTTIFDGITFALFGETSGRLRSGKEMRSLFATPEEETSVTFSFEHQQMNYEIERKPEQVLAKRKGNGTKKQAAKVTLTIFDGKGKEIKQITKRTEADQLIRELMNLDAKQFSQIVLLPQGEFRNFLVSSSSEKETVLRHLFGTQLFQQFNERLKEKAKQQQQKLDHLEQELHLLQKRFVLVKEEEAAAGFEAVLSQWTNHQAILEKQITEEKEVLADYQEKQKQLENSYYRFETLKKSYEEKATLLNKQKKLAAQKDEIEEKKRWIGYYEFTQRLIEPLQHLKEIKAEKIELSQKSSEQIKKLAMTTQHYEEWQKNETDRIHRQTKIKEAAQQLQNKQMMVPIVEALRSKKQEAGQLKHSLDKEETNAEKLHQKQAIYQERTRILQEILLDQEKLQEDRLAFGQLKHLDEKQQEIEQQKTKSIESLKQIREELKKAAEETTKNNQRLKQQIEQAEQLKSQWAKQQIARLQLFLRPGEPCLVCGSTEHPVQQSKHEQPNKEDILKVEQQLAEAESAVERTQQIIAKNEAYENNLQQQLSDLEQKIMETNIQLAGQEKHLRQALQQAFPAITEQKTTIALTVIEQSLDKRKSKIANARAELEEISQQVEKLEQQLADYKQQQTAKNNQLQQLQGEIKSLEKQLQDTDSNCLEEEIRQLEKQLEEDSKQLAAEQKAGMQLLQDLHMLRTQLDLQQEQIEKIDEKIEKEQQRIAEKLESQSYFSTTEEVCAFAQQQAQYEENQRIITTYHEAQLVTADRLRQLENIQLTEIVPDTKEISQQLEEIREMIETKQEKIYSLQEQKINNQKIYDECLSIYHTSQTQLDELTQLQQLSQTFNGENPKKTSLERYVLQVYLQEVLQVANDHLQRLTKNRYQFELADTIGSYRGKTGLEINIYDDQAGMSRSAHTLSGGESFIAALSLALALADVIQTQAGGVAIDALFIDEGFGSLDEEALEMAMEALETIESEGRMIGIISHVRELKERVLQQIRIDTEGSGQSKIRYQLG